jgi:hypothetical protein
MQEPARASCDGPGPADGVTALANCSAAANPEAAESKGFDLDLQTRPMENLDLSARVGYQTVAAVS